MFKNNNNYKILKVFLDSPTKKYGLREISRKVLIAPASVKKYLKDFEKQGLIESYKEKNNPIYRAKIDNQRLKTFQKLSIIYELEISGLIDYLWNEICPEAIILFGSYSKGEATEESDIDIFLITKTKIEEINIKKYQEKFEKEIQILTQEENKIQKHLKKNLINGIILRGYLK